MSIAKEIENLGEDINELSLFESSAQRPNVKKLLSSQIASLKQRKENLSKQLNKEITSQSQTIVDMITVSNYAWDQTSDFIKIYIDLDKSLTFNEDNIKVNFPSKKSFVITFGKYKFSISKLHADVDAEKSHYKVTKSHKLVVYLKKCVSSTWTNITEVENLYKKALEEEKEDFKSDDPSASLMNLMKKMYDEGDDEMKRTIAKSWYESRQKNMGGDTMDLGV